MSARRGRPRFRPATHQLWRHTFASEEGFIAALSERALAGDVVRVCRRYGLDAYEVVQNYPLFLVRDAEGTPIGSYPTVEQAILAGSESVQQDPDGAA